MSETLLTRENVIDECIAEISSGRTINNFGHLPEVVRALEWVVMDLCSLKDKPYRRERGTPEGEKRNGNSKAL